MPVPTPVDRYTIDPDVTRKTADTNIVNIALERPKRAYLYVYNESSATLYLKFGASASTTSYTVLIAANGYYEMPTNNRTGLCVFDGRLTAVWSSATGAAQVTEG